MKNKESSPEVLMKFIYDVGTVVLGCLIAIFLVYGSVKLLSNEDKTYAEAVPVNNFEVIEDTNFTIDKNIMDSLNIMYASFDTEFVSCIELENFEDMVIISNLNATKVLESSEYRAEFEHCETNGIIHNHKNAECEMSILDAYTFGDAGWEYLCIICGENMVSCWDTKLNKHNVKGVIENE
jgi:hypothetical protein